MLSFDTESKFMFSLRHDYRLWHTRGQVVLSRAATYAFK